MRHIARHLSGLDKFMALGLTGLGSFAMYHYVKWDEIQRMRTVKTAQNEMERMFLKITESSIPTSRVYNVNLNRSQLEYEYAQFILDSTIHQIKSVITVASGPRNSGKSTIFIRAAQIIADCIKHQTDHHDHEHQQVHINRNSLKRFSDIHVVYLNLEQGLKAALKLQFDISAESELQALSILNIILDITMKENKCILLLFDSCGYINHDEKLQNDFCRMLKHLCDSGFCYIFCLTSPQSVHTFDHDMLNNGRKYLFEDDRFLLEPNEQRALIDACYSYDGSCLQVEVRKEREDVEHVEGDLQGDSMEALYQEMKDEEQVKRGIIGDLLSYLNQSYSVQNELVLHRD